MLHAYEITPEMKDEFISLIYEGHRANEAAEAIGTTGTQMKRLRNPRGAHYDPDFAHRWALAISSEEHKTNRADNLRDDIGARSQKSDTLLIKRAYAELPEWEPLRHQNFVNIQVMVQQSVDPDTPRFIIDKLIEAHELLEAWKRGEVTQHPDVVHALPGGE